MSEPKHPLQPFVKDAHGTVRFKGNAIVLWLIDEANEGKHHDLNSIARRGFDPAEQQQFAQLIGYSLKGYHELSYVTNEAAHAATEEARRSFPDVAGCRDHGCPYHDSDTEKGGADHG